MTVTAPQSLNPNAVEPNRLQGNIILERKVSTLSLQNSELKKKLHLVNNEVSELKNDKQIYERIIDKSLVSLQQLASTGVRPATSTQGARGLQFETSNVTLLTRLGV